MNDPLYGNKVASAILAALILIVGLPLLADNFLGEGGHHGDSHHGDDEHAEVFPQYPVEIQLVSTSDNNDEPVFDLGAAMAATDAEKGKRASGLCKSCHTFEQGGANLQGPNLWNIINRPVASVGGFSYSSQIKAAGGNWTYERLDQFLKNSQAYIPGGAMNQKLRKDDRRAALLVYLSTLSDNPVAFPAPLPATEDHGDENHGESDHETE